MGSHRVKKHGMGIILRSQRFPRSELPLWKLCKSRLLWMIRIAEPLVPCGDERTFHTVDALCTGFCDPIVGDVGKRCRWAADGDGFPNLLKSTAAISKTFLKVKSLSLNRLGWISTFPASTTGTTVFFFI